MSADRRSVVDAARLVNDGATYRLSRPRFPGMPLGDGHPPFQVITYRSPQGIAAAREEPWGPGNDAQLAYSSELVIATSHSGAHIDALAHITVGEEQRWHAGTAAEIGDFGPLRGDAVEIPQLWRRGVLFDVARHREVDYLPAGSPITADELAEIERKDQLALEQGDVALIRTGYLSDWPDASRMASHPGAGPDRSAAEWLADRGVVATGSDTEAYEALPAPSGPPGNPMPVHALLLVECGIYIMEMLFLEELARDRRLVFLFVALPLAIKGATASMIDPIAVV